MIYYRHLLYRHHFPTSTSPLTIVIQMGKFNICSPRYITFSYFSAPPLFLFGLGSHFLLFVFRFHFDFADIYKNTFNRGIDISRHYFTPHVHWRRLSSFRAPPGAALAVTAISVIDCAFSIFSSLHFFFFSANIARIQVVIVAFTFQRLEPLPSKFSYILLISLNIELLGYRFHSAHSLVILIFRLLYTCHYISSVMMTLRDFNAEGNVFAAGFTRALHHMRDERLITR